MIPTQPRDPVQLEFSEKYDPAHAEHYLKKHRATFGSRLSNWREIGIARKALAMAGNPAHVLDLPCGAGRFWPMLGERADRRIIGADNSGDMIAVAMQAQPPAVVNRVTPLKTSAFAIDLPKAAVDCVFCMRLLHHIGDPANRLTMLREFHRVARQSVVVSLWIDGNLQSWRRQRLERRRQRRGKEKAVKNRFVIPRAVIEKEFDDAGFEVAGKVDFMPVFSMWRVYVLKRRG